MQSLEDKAKIEGLERQLAEAKTREAQVRTNNKVS
jgi:hypothetical protein